MVVRLSLESIKGRYIDQLPPPVPFCGAVAVPLLVPAAPFPAPIEFGALLAPPVLLDMAAFDVFFLCICLVGVVDAPVCGSEVVGLLACCASATSGIAPMQAAIRALPVILNAGVCFLTDMGFPFGLSKRLVKGIESSNALTQGFQHTLFLPTKIRVDVLVAVCGMFAFMRTLFDSEALHNGSPQR